MLKIPFRLIANVLGLLRFVIARLLFGLSRWLRRKRLTYVEVELEGSYPVGTQRRGLRRWVGSDSPSFIELRHSFKRLARAEDVDGVLLKVSPQQMGPARTGELGELVAELGEAGKHVVAYTEMLGTRELLLMSRATDVLLPETGRMYVFGYRFDEVFLAPILERLGIQGQFLHIGAFKTATHRFHKEQMTEPQRLMMEQLHAGLTRELLDAIQRREPMTDAQARELLASAPLDAADARAAGVTSGLCPESLLPAWIEHTRADRRAEQQPEGPGSARPQTWRDLEQGRALGEPLGPMKPSKGEMEAEFKDHEEVRTIPMDRYLSGRPEPWRWTPLIRRREQIAVMDLSGAIVMDDQGGPSPVGGGLTIKPEEVIPKLQKIRDGSRRWAGLLLHINSPGGSALASDLIWAEIQRTRRVMPVVCVCSDVAASGGYYLACGADQIYCRPDTLTGSIGVVTGKVSFGEAVEKLGARVESIYDEDSALFTSALHAVPERVLASLKEDARSFYRRFLERVGQARAIERARLHRYARGRVYLGRGAHRRNLVDGLGGFEQALERLCHMCHIEPARAELDFVAHRKQSLREVLTTSMQAPTPASISRAWMERLLEPAALAAWLEREPVLALMPLRRRVDAR